MARMIIMNYEEIDNDLYDFLSILCDAESPSTDDLAKALKIIESPEFQDPYAEFVLDPQLAQQLDAKTRERLLFGMAFEDQWQMDDVFIIMIHDDGQIWLKQY